MTGVIKPKKLVYKGPKSIKNNGSIRLSRLRKRVCLTSKSKRLLPQSIWEMLQEIMSDVPGSELRKIPTDASINLDHYLYGAPKKS